MNQVQQQPQTSSSQSSVTNSSPKNAVSVVSGPGNASKAEKIKDEGKNKGLHPLVDHNSSIINSIYSTSNTLMTGDAVEVIVGNRSDVGEVEYDYVWTSEDGTNHSGKISSEGQEARIPFVVTETPTKDYSIIRCTVFAKAGELRDQWQRDFVLRLPTEEISIWQVYFDNESLDSDHQNSEREVDRDPLILDLNRDGELGTTTGVTRGDGKVDGDSVLFDLDPTKSSWEFSSDTDVPGGALFGNNFQERSGRCPAVPNGYAIYSNGSRQSFGRTGRFIPDFDRGNALVYDQQGKQVGEFRQRSTDGSDRQFRYFFGNRESKERTEWLRKGSGDGFLVWDHNNDGVISDNTEMFSEFDKDGSLAFANGFEKLAHYFDKDKDGVIEGAELNGLKLWVDDNANAVTDPGELVDPSVHGIRRIVIPESGDVGTTTATKEEFLNKG